MRSSRSCPSPEGITPDLIPRMRTRAAELAAEIGAYQTDQFRNTDMVDGYLGLGEELVAQIPGPIDAFCAYVGTAGCFLGVSRALRAAYPDVARVAVEPAESAGAVGRIGRAPTASRAAAPASFPTCSTRPTSTT